MGKVSLHKAQARGERQADPRVLWPRGVGSEQTRQEMPSSRKA